MRCFICNEILEDNEDDICFVCDSKIKEEIQNSFPNTEEKENE